MIGGSVTARFYEQGHRKDIEIKYEIKIALHCVFTMPVNEAKNLVVIREP